LSKERAESVRQYLVNKGVNANRLSAEGYGPDKPLVEGTSDEARAKNRRVQFIVE
jgi:outer membrane protein OmpA-like peptidoglycan-associated protein